jgi:cytochrome c-type biogenesis protein CcmH/NrfG
MRALALGLAALLSFSACEKEKKDEADWELQRHYQLGNQALGEGNLEAAEREYRQVLSKDSTHIGALHKLARTLIKKSSPDALKEAVELLEKASTVDPGDKLVSTDLARAYRAAGLAPKALAAYQKLIELNPADTQSRLAMAEIHEQKGDLDQAEKI